ncbi:Uncharacterized protein APZ42_006300, partial [Daphnia magna]
NTLKRPFPFPSLKQPPLRCIHNSSNDCVSPPFRDRSIWHPSKKPQFFLFSPAPLTAFQQLSEDPSLLNPSNKPQFFVFSIAPLIAFQHLSETVPFCIPQTTTNSFSTYN